MLDQVDHLPVKIDWFPEYTDLRRALDLYGFLFKFSSTAEPKNSGNNCIYILVSNSVWETNFLCKENNYRII